MSKAWYALRRTIVPWRFKEMTEELLEKLPQMGVDELIAKVDVEEFFHGQPELQWVEKYCKRLKPFVKKLQNNGIVFSLNPWITVGHCDRGRDGSVNVPGLQTMVGHNGVQCTCCACQLSAPWQEHIRKVWTCYAQLKPDIIWVEDDLRTFNHKPVEFSCFCPLHMKRFSNLVGQEVTREELVAAILKPGKPHPWRKLYMDMQREVILEITNLFAETVHTVSPETSFGLMSSGPRAHCLEGRDWTKLTEAMAVGPKVVSRPPLGNYHESSLRGLYYSADMIRLTRHVLPESVVEQTEVENVPFTQYSKSVSFTFLQMAASYAFGCEGVTMNLFDHLGSPLSEEPELLDMLANEKRYLDALAETCKGKSPQRGVQVLFSDRHSYAKQLAAGSDYMSLMAEDIGLPLTLDTLGLPVTYTDEKVRATTGQIIRSFSDDEITGFLSDGLFLDATAACVLVERGFGKYIGLESIDEPVNCDTIEPLCAEEFHNKSFGGAKGKMLTLTIPNLAGRPRVSRIVADAKAKILSHLVDPDANRKMPGMLAFENSLGGRVVIHLMDWETAWGVAFNTTYRRQQVQAVMKWLNKGPLPIVAPDNVFPLLIRRDMEEQTVLAAFNLTLDDYSSFVAEFADSRKIKSVHILTDKGKWQTSKAISIDHNKGNYTLTYSKPLSYHRPLIVRIRFES